jgi:hypothetical protein
MSRPYNLLATIFLLLNKFNIVKNKINLQRFTLAEIWFRETLNRVKLLERNPSLEKVLTVLTQTHKSKIENVSRNWIEDANDPAEWLDRILKIDCLAVIENQEGKALKVGIDLTLNDSPERLEKKIEEIRQVSFLKARTQLGIDRHWIVLIPNHYHDLSAHEIADKFYSAIDQNNDIAVINL